MFKNVKNSLSSFKKSFNRFPWWARAAILGGTIFGVGIIIYDQVILDGTGGHNISMPNLEYAESTHLDICSSAQPVIDAYMRAADDYLLSTNCTPPDIQSEDCSSLKDGHVQLRSCTDILNSDKLENSDMGCPDGFYDTVVIDNKTGAGVAYTPISMENPHTPHHVLGHVMRLNHTSAASSWMHGNDYGSAPAGSKPTFIDCDPSSLRGTSDPGPTDQK